MWGLPVSLFLCCKGLAPSGQASTALLHGRAGSLMLIHFCVCISLPSEETLNAGQILQAEVT